MDECITAGIRALSSSRSNQEAREDSFTG
jgi:hypothetical protein